MKEEVNHSQKIKETLQIITIRLEKEDGFLQTMQHELGSATGAFIK